jgi:hypothetical protein
MQPQNPELPRDVPDEPPPFLGTWGRVYAAVLTYVTLVITLMYIFSEIFTK